MRKKRNLVIKSLSGTLWVPTLGCGEGEIEKPGHLTLLEPMVRVEKKLLRQEGLVDNHKSFMLRSSECLVKRETLRIQGELAGSGVRDCS